MKNESLTGQMNTLLLLKVMKEDYCAGLTITNIMKNASIFAVERLGTM